MNYKKCTVCSIDKPLDEFYNRAASEDGKAYRCKVCDNAAVKAHRHKHRDRYLKRQREANWRYKYGLSREDFELLWSSQEGRCAICTVGMVHIEMDDDSLNKHNTCCIDHCHTSGKIRGLLCARCNKALGLFDDSCASLESAIRYLSG